MRMPSRTGRWAASLLCASITVLIGAGCGDAGSGTRATVDWEIGTTPLAGKVQAAPATLASAGGGRVAASWDANPYARGTGPGAEGLALIGGGASARVVESRRAPLRGPFALRDGRVAQLTGTFNEREGLTEALHLQVVGADGTVLRDLPIGAPSLQVVAVDGKVRADGRVLIAFTSARLLTAGTAPGERGPAWRTTTSVVTGTVDAISRPRTIDVAEVSELEDPQLAVDAHASRSLVVIADAVPAGQRIRAGAGGVDGPRRLVDVAVKQERVGSVAAVLAGRRALVAWGAQPHGEEPHGPWVVHAASAPSGAGFGRPQVVDPGRVQWFPPSYRLALAALPDGGALLAWSQPGSTPDSSKDRSALMAARAGGDGRFATPQRVGRGAVGGVAVDRQGRAVLSTQRVDPPQTSGGDRTTVQVALREPGSSARFGSLQRVASWVAAQYGADPPVPAFSPSGEVLLGWLAPTGKTGGLMLARGKVNW